MSELPPPPAAGAYPAAVPPGYAGSYGAGLRPAGQFQSLRGLGTAVSVLLGLMAILGVVVAVTFASRASTVDDFLGGGNVSFSELDDADDAVAGAALVWVLGALATAVVFIVWQYRHAKNAELLGQSDGLSPGWAIGGWFIPCANFVLPIVQLFQSSQASDPSHTPGTVRRKGAGNPLVILWGIAFVAGNLAGGTSRQVLYPDAYDVSIDGPRDGVSADRLSSVGFFILAAAAVLGIAMVTSLTKRQSARVDAVGAATYGGSAYGGSAYGGSAYGGYGQQPQQPPAPAWPQQPQQPGYPQQPGWPQQPAPGQPPGWAPPAPPAAPPPAYGQPGYDQQPGWGNPGT